MSIDHRAQNRLDGLAIERRRHGAQSVQHLWDGHFALDVEVRRRPIEQKPFLRVEHRDRGNDRNVIRGHRFHRGVGHLFEIDNVRQRIDAAGDRVDDVDGATDVRERANAVFVGGGGERRDDLRGDAGRFERHAIDGDLEHVGVPAERARSTCVRAVLRRGDLT